MSFTVAYGDVFAHPAEALAHGVNCKGVTGGLASAVADRYPDAMTQYVLAARAGKLEPGQALLTRNRGARVVIHCASQRNPGADARLMWLAASLNDGLAQAQASGISSVVLPLIGGGIGGLDPAAAEKTIRDVSELYPLAVTLVLPR